MNQLTDTHFEPPYYEIREPRRTPLTKQRRSTERERMSEQHHNLLRLSQGELMDLLDKSAILEGYQAEAFARALREVPLYQSEAQLQLVHSKAILSRMQETFDFEEALVLSHIQEAMPSFYLSLTLRQSFARGLVVTAHKNPARSVIERALSRITRLPSFNSCPILQRCTGELLLEGVATSDTPEEAECFLRQFRSLPGMNYCKELQKIEACAQREAKRAGRDPIVKIDLNQKLAKPFKAVGKLLGMGDFRMRVEVRGLEYYDQVVVKVPAFTEAAARRAANKFIIDFLRNQSGDDERKSAKILDVFPPGSPWESGRHPILNLNE